MESMVWSGRHPVFNAWSSRRYPLRLMPAGTCVTICRLVHTDDPMTLQGKSEAAAALHQIVLLKTCAQLKNDTHPTLTACGRFILQNSRQYHTNLALYCKGSKARLLASSCRSQGSAPIAGWVSFLYCQLQAHCTAIGLQTGLWIRCVAPITLYSK